MRDVIISNFLYFSYFHYSNVFLIFSVKKDSGSANEEKSPIPKLKINVITGDDLSINPESQSGDSGTTNSSDESSNESSDKNIVKKPRRSSRIQSKVAAKGKLKKEIERLRKKRKVRAMFMRTESTEMYVYASGKTTSMDKLKGRKKKEELR